MESLKLTVNTALAQGIFIVGEKYETQGEAGLKLTYDNCSKEVKAVRRRKKNTP